MATSYVGKGVYSDGTAAAPDQKQLAKAAIAKIDTGISQLREVLDERVSGRGASSLVDFVYSRAVPINEALDMLQNGDSEMRSKAGEVGDRIFATLKTNELATTLKGRPSISAKSSGTKQQIRTNVGIVMREAESLRRYLNRYV